MAHAARRLQQREALRATPRLTAVQDFWGIRALAPDPPLPFLDGSWGFGAECEIIECHQVAKMKQHLLAVLRQSPRERALLASAWIRLLVTDLALRLLPLSQVPRCIVPAKLAGHSTAGGFTAEQLAFLVNVASRHHLYPMSCLRRALVLETILRRHGFEASLRIGVCRVGEALRAHAWVESEGRPVGDRPDIAMEFLPLLSTESVVPARWAS